MSHLFSPCLELLLLSVMLYVIGYPLGHFGSTAPAVAPPNPLESQLKKQKRLCKLCKHYSASARTLAFYQHCSGDQSKTLHHLSCYEEKVTPSQEDWVQLHEIQKIKISFSKTSKHQTQGCYKSLMLPLTFILLIQDIYGKQWLNMSQQCAYRWPRMCPKDIKESW